MGWSYESRPNQTTNMLQIAIIIALLLLIPITFALLGARQVMYPPRPRQRAFPPGGQAVTFAAPDGVTLRGWFFPVDRPKGVIVYGPGRGEGLNAFDFRYIPLFNRHGYSVFMFDARGLGASDGVSSLGAREWLDYLGAVDWVRNPQSPIANLPLGFCGASQGAASAIMAAARCPSAVAVAVECPYASWQTTLFYALQDYAHLPAPLARPGAWLVARALELHLGFRAPEADPVRVVAAIAPRALFIIHGPHDPYIPMSEVQRLFDTAGEPKELWVLPEAGHTQALELRPEECEQRLIAFFDRWLA